jgi:hypothetical protein
MFILEILSNSFYSISVAKIFKMTSIISGEVVAEWYIKTTEAWHMQTWIINILWIINKNTCSKP